MIHCFFPPFSPHSKSLLFNPYAMVTYCFLPLAVKHCMHIGLQFDSFCLRLHLILWEALLLVLVPLRSIKSCLMMFSGKPAKTSVFSVPGVLACMDSPSQTSAHQHSTHFLVQWAYQWCICTSVFKPSSIMQSHMRYFPLGPE